MLNAVTDYLMFFTVPYMLVTLVCILGGYNRNCIPTLLSLCGSITYAMLLAFAWQSMSSMALRTYVTLLIAFSVYTAIAYADYRQKQRKREVNRKKLENFKRECKNARGAAA